MGGRMTTNSAAPVRTWGSPDENLVLVDDVKALRQAVHDEMELIGCGFHQHRVVTILGFGNVADAVEILAIGYILTVYEDSEGEMTSWESSLLTAAVFAGMLGGGLVGGVAGDLYGRKPVPARNIGHQRHRCLFVSFFAECLLAYLLPSHGGLRRRLFERPNAGPTLLLMLCGFSLSFGSYGLSTWITKLFKSAGLANPFENAFLFAGANLPGNVVSLYLIDIIGHQRLLSGALFTSAFCALLFAFNVEGSKTIIVLVSCLFNASTTAAWNGFGVLSTENFPQELRTTGISVVNCSNRVAAITSQFVNGFLMGPPPHLEALLLVTTTVMCTGGIASRWIAHGGDDDIDAISKSDSSEDTEADPEGSPSLCGDEGEHAGLIRHDVLFNEKKNSPRRDIKEVKSS
ncbi:hypothetical protein AM588_10007849 [Phytophthora nicotianae]|uniref:Major facilitator superfamily (MFS) profile domain-containing protein n=1 Tax=Phytophthora nicotianae TaxID=4792 RepID=A0A0W8DKB0_PHYNI|nr:hypothetical protein AM588_10007849 [Phytophthora nicotianae]